MLHAIAIWLVAAAFGGAGVVNAIGAPAQRQSFVRWGYPAWWCRGTGVLEVAAAALIALQAIRPMGLILGAAIIASATVTVVRHREWSHLAPLGAFAVLLGMAVV
ncbi:DoxX family protein [Lichenihabitans sp. Uapishka_5]|uniref:DoxX family protein n=1 Tax=Lichenihabitans sp. Uapishka_5 TaxID=3037302 RepID=UPI0029E7F086|nr:DoxX family protein [Lichenihabitans sp. Uapishka_5]MDX7951471.1 DoxX family protein [Lichenihabitans sp. Uapishka_5]